MRTYPTNRIRAGFTLVELLVVIAIIGILASLATWGTFAMVANRQRSNTELTIRVVNKLLQTRWSAVVADAKKETPSPAVLALAGDAERARIIWIKVRLLEAFPHQFSDVVPGVTVNKYIPANRLKPHFLKYQKELASMAPGKPGESSACLLLALKMLGSDGVNFDDQIKFAIAPNDGAPGYSGTVNTINTLVDGFGRPLVFERFFIGAPNPAPAGSRNAKFGDPIDTDGKLLSFPAASKATYETEFQHTIGVGNANYVIPRITSLGKDGNPGTQDDLHNYLLQGD